MSNRRNQLLALVVVGLLVYSYSQLFGANEEAGKSEFVSTTLAAYHRSKNKYVGTTSTSSTTTTVMMRNGYSIVPGADLAYLYWPGLDLPGIDLSRANFRNANLSGSNFTDADLTDARFENANFSGADLRGAKLDGANFQNANFSGADLRGAKLDGANFQNANFSGADFTSAVLVRAVFDRSDFNGAILRQANLNSTSGAFRGSNFDDVDFTGAHLCGHSFDFSRMRGAFGWKECPQAPLPPHATLPKKQDTKFDHTCIDYGFCDDYEEPYIGESPEAPLRPHTTSPKKRYKIFENTCRGGDECYPGFNSEYPESINDYYDDYEEPCIGDCWDMDNDGRTYDDVDGDGDGIYESP